MLCLYASSLNGSAYLIRQVEVEEVIARLLSPRVEHDQD